MELRHFAEKRIELDRSRAYPVADRAERSPFAKPRGLWISDESQYGWRKWCEEEQFRLGGLVHEHEVTLTIGTQPLLLLSTAEQVREFSARFSYREDYGTNGEIEHTGIDWAAVREKLAGCSSRRTSGNCGSSWTGTTAGTWRAGACGTCR